MDTKTQNEVFTKLTEEITPLVEDGKIESSKLTEVLNRMKENDTATPTAEELKIIEREDKINKLLEDSKNQFAEQQKSNIIFNDALLKLSGKGSATQDYMCLNAMQEGEINKVREEDRNDYTFGRYIECMANKFLNKASEADHKYLNAVQSTLTDAAGNYTLETQVLQTIFDDLSETGRFFSETTPINFAKGKGKTKQIPTVASTGHPTPAKVSEDGAKPIQNFTFTQIDLTLIKYACIVPFTKEFEMYSPLDFASTVRRYATEWFGAVFDDILFNGDANINGLQDISTTNATITGTQMAGLTVNDLLDVIGGMRSGDMVGAKWYWHPTVWAKLFQKENTAGQREFPLNDINGRTLLGFPVIVSDYMQTYVSGASASTDFGYFGNLKKLFVGKYGGLDISFSDQASYVSGETTVHMWQKNEMGFRLEMFVDMDCAFPSRITAIKTAAA